MNIPNILTVIRMGLVPLFAVVFFNDRMEHNLLIALIIFLAAGITDVLDGYIARKFNLITKFGIVLDPLADKLMIVTVLFCLYIRNIIPFWIFAIMFLKEVGMTLAAVKLYKKDVVIPSNYLGKATTVTFYIAIILSILRSNGVIHVSKMFPIVLFCIAIIMAISALLKYALGYLKSSKAKNNI